MRYAVITGASCKNEITGNLPANFAVVFELPAEHERIVAVIGTPSTIHPRDWSFRAHVAPTLAAAGLTCADVPSRDRAIEHATHLAGVAQANDPHTNYGCW